MHCEAFGVGRLSSNVLSLARTLKVDSASCVVHVVVLVVVVVIATRAHLTRSPICIAIGDDDTSGRGGDCINSIDSAVCV